MRVSGSYETLVGPVCTTISCSPRLHPVATRMLSNNRNSIKRHCIARASGAYNGVLVPLTMLQKWKARGLKRGDEFLNCAESVLEVSKIFLKLLVVEVERVEKAMRL